MEESTGSLLSPRPAQVPGQVVDEEVKVYKIHVGFFFSFFFFLLASSSFLFFPLLPFAATARWRNERANVT